ncbi:T9SS type A sorting domain-containing protein [Chryseobacterium sp. LAM-KRS1]|uniref:T9SS type A sorting domain-containing protein n=1 Tax=Chryseobacterium sp. LAM-KRS1 TaxID=2715754 RepID=UPI001554BCF5|nr:T9SS type A sorting domain-containing protein [Chryseobacterium sp. LAM-KRS1]
MKKILLFIILYSNSVFSQNTNSCNYVFSPPPIGSGGNLTHPNQAIHAIDLAIEDNTTVNFDSAEIYVMSMSAQPQQVNQAKIYLYNDQNGVPGNLISNLDVIPTSVIFLGETGSVAGILISYYKVTIPIPFNSVDSSVGNKVWFGYTLKTPNDEVVYQFLRPKTDATGLCTLINNVWQTSNFETPLTIIKNCNVSTLAINDVLHEKSIIYPNPTKGDIFFKHMDVRNVELFDLNGRKLEIKISKSKIDISLLPQGIYFLKYIYNGSVSYEKIIKN